MDASSLTFADRLKRVKGDEHRQYIDHKINRTPIDIDIILYLTTSQPPEPTMQQVLFFIVPAFIASAQAQETSFKHLKDKEQQELVGGVDAALKTSFKQRKQRKERRALFDGLDAASVSMSMAPSAFEMPTDGIQGEKEPTISSADMSDFLSKFKKEHIELAEALYDASFKQDEGLAEIVSAQDEDFDGINEFRNTVASFMDTHSMSMSPTCIHPSEKTTKSSKSGKGSKIKLFTVERALEAGVLASATIYDGRMYTPAIRNNRMYSDVADGFQVAGWGGVWDLFFEALYNFKILEDYLACAGTKIENVLTYKVYVSAEGCGFELFVAIFAFIAWWLCSAGGELDLLPTISFVYVPYGTPAFPGTILGTQVMLEATAAIP